MKSAKRRKPGSDEPNPRSLARVAAVQALYQMDLAGTDLTDVIEEFVSLRLAPPDSSSGTTGEADSEGGSGLEGADPTYFADLLRGVVRRQRDIDPMIDQQLASGWRLVRVDSILRAILRAGVFELLERDDVPARVAINEFINVAHAFFEGDEPRVVNGVLDRVAHRLRPAEFETRKDA